ncbi:VanZ family protein [Longimicrobium sp.]|uniref:VanZ family protein n=1 Tax=Longimicrobium sp. TaxID=2029185 RepID=UPI002BBC2B82|nr:VanZ family protein [Longimicrobium sp.]HSU13302.1 VanZ family protein [Longimicrobium sp.]
MTDSGRSPQRIASLAVLLAVLVAVLAPQPGRDYPITWCLACGERAGSDAVRNLLLFVPLGMVAAGWLRPAALAAAACAALSLGVEAAQVWIPGRDPALSDFLFNSLGAAAGVALARSRSVWLRPSRRGAGRLVLGWAALVWAAVAATGWLLAPATWSPRLAVAERDGDDLILRVHTRAEWLHLDQPVVRWRGALRGVGAEAGERFLATQGRGGWCMRAGARRRCGMGATAGSGWGMIVFPDAIARRIGSLVDAAWAAFLFVPLGFWLRRGRISIAAMGIAFAVLAVLPALGLLARTPAPEWLGAAMGIAAGVGLARVVGSEGE